MATRPVNCPYDEDPGFRFNRGYLVLDTPTTNYPEKFIRMDDMFEEITSYSKLRVNLLPSSCYLLSQTDISDSQGFVSFILVKSIFPDGTLETKKYLTWEYDGYTYDMGKLMLLSGENITDFSSSPAGWNISQPGTVYENGGIIFCNPHSDITIKLEILIAR
jgi:hypothetical protein